MKVTLKNAAGARMVAVRFEGCETKSAEEIEDVLGPSFVSLVPSRNVVLYKGFTGEQELVVGEWALWWESGIRSVSSDEDVREWFTEDVE